MRIISFVLLMVLTLPIMAADIIVKTKDGGEYKFVLESKSCMSFEGANLTLDQGGVIHTFELTNIKNVTYGDVQNGNDGIKHIAENTTLSVSYQNGCVVVSNLKPEETVTLYTVKGEKTDSAKADEQGVAKLNINNVAKGIYIISTGKSSHKILKK